MRLATKRPHELSTLGLTGGLVVFSAVVAACRTSPVPDPKDALVAYQAALEKGDADAIYAMLSKRSQRSLRVGDVQHLISDERRELVAAAEAAREPASTVRAAAELRYPDGEDVTLAVEGGEFRVTAAFGLPAARTAREALEDLRRALARRSYAALMRVLSPATRSAVESDLRSLVDGLAHPEGLKVQETGDAAQVQVPGGHLVKLRRESGVWRVEDFD